MVRYVDCGESQQMETTHDRDSDSRHPERARDDSTTGPSEFPAAPQAIDPWDDEEESGRIGPIDVYADERQAERDVEAARESSFDQDTHELLDPREVETEEGYRADASEFENVAGQILEDFELFTKDALERLAQAPEVGDSPRDERAHPAEATGATGSEVRGESKERKGRDEPERVRSPGDHFQTLISALCEIDAVLRGEQRWCVIHADCFEILRCLPDRLVTHVITDPPYEAEAHTKRKRVLRNEAGRRVRGVRTEPISFEPITETERAEAGAAFARLAQRWILVFCQIEATMKWRASIESGGAQYMRTCLWDKPDGQPQMSGDRPGMGYETFLAMHRRGRSAWNRGGMRGVFTHSARWSGGEPHDNDCEKPPELMMDLVDAFTDPDDIILDPFAGSGTTGSAALKLGRRAILIEKDAISAQICRDRLTAEDEDSTLRARRAGQLPLMGAT